MYQNFMYCKSCAKKLFFEKFKKELYLKVMCTVKVMMRFYVSEHVCYKLYTKLYLQIITFQRKKLIDFIRTGIAFLFRKQIIPHNFPILEHYNLYIYNLQV